MRRGMGRMRSLLGVQTRVTQIAALRINNATAYIPVPIPTPTGP